MACSRAPSPPPASACTRTEFDAFPYKPYAIQEQFMQAVYRALTQGGVAMVESPTGTGKTLSLICSALAWLEDQHKLQEVGLASMHSTDQNGQKADAKEEEPDWMQDFDKNREQKEQKKKEERRRVRLQAVEQRRLQGVRVREDTGKKHSKVFTLGKASSKVRQGVKLESKEQSVEAFGNGIDDDEFLAEDWDSDEEGFHKRKKKPAGQPSSDNESDDSKTEEEEEEEEEEPLKVFFCSRTHSQVILLPSQRYHMSM